MIFGSSSKNINILTLIIIIGGMSGLFYFPFDIRYLVLSILSFYVLNILGVWMTYHRYYSHRSFEFKNNFVKFFFTCLAILAARGSPISWVYIHRNHHSYSDTDKDPHSPIILGYKIFGFNHFSKFESADKKMFLIRDLMTKHQILIHKYYILILLGLLSCLAFFSIELVFWLWCLPVILIHFSQNTFNYIGHVFGYSNFVTKDNSKNNTLLFPILLGECWHNNHHANPKKLTTKHLKHEFDPLVYFINLISLKHVTK